MTLRLGNKKVCPTKIVEKEIKIYLIRDYTTTGTVADNSGVLSNFSVDNYATSIGSTSSLSTYEINVNFTTPTFSGTNSLPIIAKETGTGGDVYIKGETKTIASWNGSTAQIGTTILDSNKNYSFKLVRGDSSTSMYLKEGLPSDNISDYTLEYSGYSNYFDSTKIIFGKYGTQQYFKNGSIDMRYCTITSGGNIIWQGLKEFN